VLSREEFDRSRAFLVIIRHVIFACAHGEKPHQSGIIGLQQFRDDLHVPAKLLRETPQPPRSSKRLLLPATGRIRRIASGEAIWSVDAFRLLAGSLDLLDVDLLPVEAVIRVAGHVALRVADKRDASQIIFDEERIGTQWQVLILILSHYGVTGSMRWSWVRLSLFEEL
jgi:hypothetical protein